MPVFRRRRGHPYGLTASFNEVSYYFSDDAKTFAYYFDDALTKRYVNNDG